MSHYSFRRFFVVAFLLNAFFLPAVSVAHAQNTADQNLASLSGAVESLKDILASFSRILSSVPRAQNAALLPSNIAGLYPSSQESAIFLISNSPKKLGLFAGNQLYTSTDGNNWQVQGPTIFGGGNNLVCPSFRVGMSYGNGKFVGICGTTLAVSSDGVSWQTSTAPLLLSGMTFLNGYFYSTTHNSGGYYVHLARSVDGATWEELMSSPGAGVNSLSYGGGKFLAFGGVNTSALYPYTSADGNNWTQGQRIVLPSGTTAYNPLALTYSNGKFIYAFSGGSPSITFPSTYVSTDGGSTWSRATGSFLASEISSPTTGSSQYSFGAFGGDRGGFFSLDGTKLSYSGASFTDMISDVFFNASASKYADSVAPSAPGGVALNTQNSFSGFPCTATTCYNATIKWNGATDSGGGVSGYYFYVDGKLAAIVSGLSATYTFESNKNYTVEVSAVDAAGNESSKTSFLYNSNPVSDSTPPTSPVLSVAMAPQGSTLICAQLSWTASTDAQGIQYYEINRSGTKWTTTLMNYSDTQTCSQQNTTVSYTVTAYDNSGNVSAPSNIVSINPASALGSDTTAPTTPGTPTASNITQTGATLSWSASTDTGGSGLVGYKVFRNGTQIATPTVNNFSDSGLSPSTQYSYVVSAYDGASNVSPASPTMVLTTLASIVPGAIFSLTSAPSVAAQNISVATLNQVLGGFDIDVRNESVSLRNFSFSVAAVPSNVNPLTSISLYDSNGVIVAGPVDAVSGVITFSDTVTFPVGKRTYTIKGKIPVGFANNTIVTLSANLSQWPNGTGQTTGNAVSLSGLSSFSTNPMTVKVPKINISMSFSPAPQTIVPGEAGRIFANYQLDATQSGEDIRFSTLPLKYTFSTGAAANLSGCKMNQGGVVLTTGSNVVNPQANAVSGSSITVTFDNFFTVSKGTVSTLSLSCNVFSGAPSGSTYAWGIGSSLPTKPTGVISGLQADTTVVPSAGSTMTIGAGTGAGSLQVSLDASSPSYLLSTSGEQNKTILTLRVHASTESVQLQRLGLKLSAGSSSSLSSVSVWDGGVQVGSAIFIGTNKAATSTFSSAVLIPKDTDKVLMVKANFAPIGTGQPGKSGEFIAIDFNDADPSATQGAGVSSGLTIRASGFTGTAGVRTFKSIPTLTYNNASGTFISGSQDLLTFAVSAAPAGDIQLNKLTFGIQLTNVSLSGLEIIGPNGKVSSKIPLSLSGAGGNAEFYFDSPTNIGDRIIPAGTSKSFTIRSVVTGNGLSGLVAPSLKRDTVVVNGMFSASNLSSNIIWSPSSVGTALPSSADWTNGYGLSGCFSLVGLGNDCTAKVLAGTASGTSTIAPDTTAPSTPGTPTASNITQTSVALTWSASTDASGVQSYKVFRNNVQVGNPTLTSFTDSGLVAGTTYSYAVLSRDTLGNESARSTAVSVATVAPTASYVSSTPTLSSPAPSPLPPQVGGVIVQSLTDSSVSLRWNAPATGLSYRVKRDGAIVSGTAETSHTDSGLSPATVYEYRICSVNAVGETCSNVFAVSTLVKQIVALSPVTTSANPVAPAPSAISSSPVTTVIPSAVVLPQIVSEPKEVWPTAPGKFMLYSGVYANEVYALQECLARGGYLSSSSYSGFEGWYGSKTKAAVGKFQIEKGVITNPSSLALGIVGPTTLNRLNSDLTCNIYSVSKGDSVVSLPTPASASAPSPLVSPSPSGTFAPTAAPTFSPSSPSVFLGAEIWPRARDDRFRLYPGVYAEEVVKLQRCLIGGGFLSSSATAGAEGWYGRKTSVAVGTFQIQNGILSSTASPAYGIVGPTTLEKLNSTFGCGITNITR